MGWQVLMASVSHSGLDSAPMPGETYDCPVGILPEKAMQPIPVFLPGESHGQRILVGYGPCDCKESDRTEVTEQEATNKLKDSEP